MGHCDTITILSMREVCARYRLFAREVYRDVRQRIVGHYIETTGPFLDLIHQEGSLVIGVAALALVILDVSILGMYLEIAARRTSEGVWETYLQDTLGATLLWKSSGTLDGWEWMGPYEKWFRLRSHRFVRLVYSRSTSALEAIAWSENTAQMNYFNRESFGCAFPILTLRRVALTQSWRTMTSPQRRRIAHLHVRAKFVFRAYPGPLMGADPPETFKIAGEKRERYACYRDLFLCPEQERFFGDEGSLMMFFEGEDEDVVGQVRRDCQAPFGDIAVWRVNWSTRAVCAGGCRRGAEILGGWHVLVLAVPSGAMIRVGEFRGMRMLQEGSLRVIRSVNGNVGALRWTLTSIRQLTNYRLWRRSYA